MAAYIVALDTLKGYMKIDTDDSDEQVRMMGRAAEAYLQEAGIDPDACDEDLYTLAACSLALHWYENRIPIAYYRSEIPLGARSIINQLKFTRRA